MLDLPRECASADNGRNGSSVSHRATEESNVQGDMPPPPMAVVGLDIPETGLDSSPPNPRDIADEGRG